MLTIAIEDILKLATKELSGKGGTYTELMVCRSAAGWYVGRSFIGEDGFPSPGSRESNYYETEEEAMTHILKLTQGLDVGESVNLRLVPENLRMYEVHVEMNKLFGGN